MAPRLRLSLAVPVAAIVGGSLVWSACSPSDDPEPDRTAPATTQPTTTRPLPVVDAEIAALADRTGMTDDARRAFYEADPHFVDKEELGDSCPLREETSVLGCYGDRRITILRVDDPRLDGMEETTAAHEMLHAVWDDLDPSTRSELVAQLGDAYRERDDARLREKVEAYRRVDPSVVDAELYAILATEVPDLPADLEAHYAQWFTERGRVVSLAAGAQHTFEDLLARVATLDAELATRRPSIDDEEARLTSENAALDALNAELEALLAAGRVEEYNAGVDDYNARVDQYNAAREALQATIDEYNGIVAFRNGLLEVYADLADTIDTTLAATPAA